MWGPAVFFSLVRSALPFGSAIPSSFIHQVLSLDVRLLLGLPAPWQPVVDQIKKLKAEGIWRRRFFCFVLKEKICFFCFFFFPGMESHFWRMLGLWVSEMLERWWPYVAMKYHRGTR